MIQIVLVLEITEIPLTCFFKVSRWLLWLLPSGLHFRRVETERGKDLPAILIPACGSSSPAFLMMYSTQKLNKQGDDIQPWRTPFPIWNQSVVPCPVLTVASWPDLLPEAGQVVWYPHLFQNFPQFIVTNSFISSRLSVLLAYSLL